MSNENENVDRWGTTTDKLIQGDGSNDGVTSVTDSLQKSIEDAGARDTDPGDEPDGSLPEDASAGQKSGAHVEAPSPDDADGLAGDDDDSEDSDEEDSEEGEEES